jgi:hypothetical protein
VRVDHDARSSAAAILNVDEITIFNSAQGTEELLVKG